MLKFSSMLNLSLFKTLFIFVSFLSAPAFAVDNENILDAELSASEQNLVPLNISAEKAHAQTQAFLRHLNVREEPGSQFFLQDLSGLQKSDKINSLLNFIDPKKTFFRFADFSEMSVVGFKDFDAKKINDFEIELNNESSKNLEDNFHQRLKRAKKNFKNNLRPLSGLRIAIDPGHMGSPEWDMRTGKFVKDKAGNKLSEGLLVLQTSLLLEQRLTELGAEVLVTHRTPAPVTTTPINEINIDDYAREEMKAQTLAPWFLRALNLNLNDEDFFKTVKQQDEFKKLFSEAKRSDYFILRADLDARAEMINEFKPDLTFIIHMDTTSPPNDSHGLNPTRYNKTKTFIQGNLSPQEWAAPKQRRQVLRHLLNPHSWDASLNLCRHVVNKIKKNLNLELENYNINNSKIVEPGISARNLSLSRQITDTALCYIEAFYYNDPVEFNTLRRYTRTMSIDGKDYPYSERLVDLAASLTEAAMDFVEHYNP